MRLNDYYLNLIYSEYRWCYIIFRQDKEYGESEQITLDWYSQGYIEYQDAMDAGQEHIYNIINETNN